MCIRDSIRSVSIELYQELFRLIIIAFTVWQVFLGSLEVGILAMVLLYFGKIEEAASEFAQTYSEFVSSKIDMFRMKEIMRTEPSIENTGELSFNENWQTLKFKDVSFAYHGQSVLKGFSLDIERGQKIGIAGISGAGKSTLFKLLLKLYEGYKGDIVFDKCSLEDIKPVSYTHLTLPTTPYV